MKRVAVLLTLLIAVAFGVAADARADQTYEYWAWNSNSPPYPPGIYCGPPWPNMTVYYTYMQVGGKTIYCDLTESSWGDTSCELDVRLADATPCY